MLVGHWRPFGYGGEKGVGRRVEGTSLGDCVALFQAVISFPLDKHPSDEDDGAVKWTEIHKGSKR